MVAHYKRAVSCPLLPIFRFEIMASRYSMNSRRTPAAANSSVKKLCDVDIRKTIANSIFDSNVEFGLSDERWLPLSPYPDGRLPINMSLVSQKVLIPDKWHDVAKQIRAQFCSEFDISLEKKATSSHQGKASSKQATPTSKNTFPDIPDSTAPFIQKHHLDTPWTNFNVEELRRKTAIFPYKFNNAITIDRLFFTNNHTYLFDCTVTGEDQVPVQCVVKCCRLFDPHAVFARMFNFDQFGPMTHGSSQTSSSSPTQTGGWKKRSTAPAGHKPTMTSSVSGSSVSNFSAAIKRHALTHSPQQPEITNDAIESLVHFSESATFMVEIWMEIISWATLYPEYFFGNCNVRDPATGAYYSLLFIPKFYSTFLKFSQDLINQHDNRGAEIERQNLAPSKPLPAEPVLFTWPDVLHAVFCQIMLVTLMPFKNRFRLSHNDFKANNVVYVPTRHKYVFVRIFATEKARKAYYKIIADNKGKFDGSFAVTEEPFKPTPECDFVLLQIPTFDRKFSLIDFGFTYLEVAGENLCSLSPVQCLEQGMVYNNQFTDFAQLAYSLLREFLKKWPEAFYQILMKQMPTSKCNMAPTWSELFLFLGHIARRDSGELINIDTTAWNEEMYADVAASCTWTKWDIILPHIIQRYRVPSNSKLIPNPERNDLVPIISDIVWSGAQLML